MNKIESWLDGGPLDDDDDWLNAGDDADVRLMDITGLSAAAVEAARAAGAPGDVAEFFHWYVRNQVEDGVSFEAAKAVKTAAEARLKEMQLARLNGETKTLDEVIAVFREEAATVRSQLMALPGRCATLLAAETDVAVIESAVLAEVDSALLNFTGDRPETWKGQD